MSRPEVPNYLPQLTEALMKARAEPSAIRSFAGYWRALPPGTHKLPCPLCYMDGHQGWLMALMEKARVQSVRCDRCRTEIVVSDFTQ